MATKKKRRTESGGADRPIRRILISVYDKTGVVDLAAFLAKKGVEIVSTGGTAKLLEKNGVKVVDVSSVTGYPEMMDGRVKTLHPAVHGGILALRSSSQHMDQLKNQQIVPIDAVVVNLYPFETVTKSSSVTLDVAIENIDIGGPTMIRSAAKNYEDVTVLTDPGQYEEFKTAFQKGSGTIPEELRRKFALAAFERTAVYDMAIYNHLFKAFHEGEIFPGTLFQRFTRKETLRYGENPHQNAAHYIEPDFTGVSIGRCEQLRGRQLSYNNILDANAALELLLEFDKEACVVVKHGNPTGVAVDPDCFRSYVRARDVDPMSAFGGIVAFNIPVDKKTAKELLTSFIEIVVAPRFTEGAMEVFRASKKNLNLRLLQLNVDNLKHPKNQMDFKRILGGLTYQNFDDVLLPEATNLQLVTKYKPTRKQLGDMILAWKVCKCVKSNAIVVAKGNQTFGTGAGQMSRIDSMKIALAKAAGRAQGGVLASDAFFPFRDAVDEAAKHGIACIIQPGGSIRDDEVIAAADEHGIAMAFTKMRHFRH